MNSTNFIVLHAIIFCLIIQKLYFSTITINFQFETDEGQNLFSVKPILTEFKDPRTFLQNLKPELPSLREKEKCNQTFLHDEISLNTTGGFDISSAKLIETLKSYQKYISSYGLTNGCIVEKRRKIAFIMPFRDNGSNVRTSQFFWLINTYIPIFIKQKADVQFFVINQGGHPDVPFNRAKLFNAGFQIAKKGDFDCFFFSDIDLMAMDDRVPLKCIDTPRHYSAWLDSQNFKIAYKLIFGGTVAFTPEAFKDVNGFSNQFWGWGGEDDEMAVRVRNKFKTFARTDSETAHFHRLFHPRENGNSPATRILKTSDGAIFKHIKCSAKRSPYDGLNTVDFEILEEQNYHLIRNITVDLKFTTTRQPEKMCPTDKVFQDLGREFAEKIKAEGHKKTISSATTPSPQPEKSPIMSKMKLPGKISIEMDPGKPVKSFVVDGVRILF